MAKLVRDRIEPPNPRLLVLVKHGTPVLDGTKPAREWTLSPRGESEAVALAEDIGRYAPSHILASSEPKAERTAQLIAARLGLNVRVLDGIRELDRAALPIMDPAAHRELNRPIFLEPDRAVLGAESASAALERFQTSIQAEIDSSPTKNLVAVSHGTVIALFVGQYNNVAIFDFWSRFHCGHFVSLAIPSFKIVELRHGNIVDTA
jgi:broad specificity phosphatase PhoE